MNEFKDYNDLHKAGKSIANLKTIPLDVACLDVLLSESKDIQSEYKQVREFCKTVRDGMIKADIAKSLSKRWDKELSEVKEYISFDQATEEELLSKVHGFEDSFLDFKDYMSEPGSTIGWPSIDQKMGGVKRKEVVVLGAYSNHGKSFFATKVICHRILEHNDNVLVFSMEMPRGQLLCEIIKEIMHMDEESLFAYMKTENGINIYNKVKEKLEKKLMIVDEPNKSIEDVEKITSLLIANDFNVDFVVYDHFHLIPHVEDFQRQSEIANALKTYVKKFNLRLLMLAQFNEDSQRGYTNGKKKRYEPMMTNLKGANNLKAIADHVLLIWRPYYTDTHLDFVEREALKFITCVKVAKVRRQTKGSMFINLEFDPATTELRETVLEQ